MAPPVPRVRTIKAVKRNNGRKRYEERRFESQGRDWQDPPAGYFFFVRVHIVELERTLIIEGTGVPILTFVGGDLDALLPLVGIILMYARCASLFV